MVDLFDAVTQTEQNVSRKRLNPVAELARAHPRMQATQTISGDCAFCRDLPSLDDDQFRSISRRPVLGLYDHVGFPCERT